MGDCAGIQFDADIAAAANLRTVFFILGIAALVTVDMAVRIAFFLAIYRNIRIVDQVPVVSHHHQFGALDEKLPLVAFVPLIGEWTRMDGHIPRQALSPMRWRRRQIASPSPIVPCSYTHKGHDRDRENSGKDAYRPMKGYPLQAHQGQYTDEIGAVLLEPRSPAVQRSGF